MHAHTRGQRAHGAPVLPARWLLIALLVLLTPRWTAAQAGPIVLTVQLRSTVADAPIPHVAIRVLEAASGHLLAQGMTDQRGQARFAQMPPTEVRVQLTGTLPDGTALRPTPQDTQGIWVNLPGHDWRMDLRVDTDGLVFPDLSASGAGAPDAQDGVAGVPGTASTIVGSTSGAVSPTAPRARPSASLPAHRLAVVPGPASAPATAVSGAAITPAADLPGALLLVLLVGMIGGVLWFVARSRLSHHR